MSEFFDDIVAKALPTVAAIFERQGRAELASTLRGAKAWVEQLGVDPDRELTFHALNLEVPVDVYAAHEAQLNEAETEILSKLNAALRSYRHDLLHAVVIGPILDPPMTTESSLPANAADHIWESGLLRLFISHVAEHKAAVGELKRHLRTIGVSGFVAHQDIAPSLEWQSEIDLALRTTQAALALLTSDFHESHWTDQEIGIAIARGVVVIPVDLGVTPYGFMGKYQALGGALDAPEALADAIVAILQSRTATVAALREGLVTALEQANTYKAAKKVTRLLRSMPRDFSEGQLTRIRAAVTENNQVSDAIGVPEALSLITG